MEVTAKLKDGPERKVEYRDLDAADIHQLLETFGEDAVFNHAKRSFVVALQSFMRTQIEAGKSDEEMQAAVEEWKPGVKRPGKSTQERVNELLSKLDPAARDALLKEYGIGSGGGKKKEKQAA